MWPDRVSNPGPLTYESGALPTALRGPASRYKEELSPGQHDRSCTTVKILGIRTDRFDQTVQLQMRLLEVCSGSSLFVGTDCYSSDLFAIPSASFECITAL